MMQMRFFHGVRVFHPLHTYRSGVVGVVLCISSIVRNYDGLI